MTRGVIQDFVQDEFGNKEAAATVEVRRSSDNLLAQIYDQIEGGNELSNPVLTDDDGYFKVYADLDDYNLIITTTTSTYTLFNVAAISTDALRDNLEQVQLVQEAVEATLAAVVEPDKATADGNLPTYTDGDRVLVVADETNGGDTALYEVQAGALVFVTLLKNLSFDNLLNKTLGTGEYSTTGTLTSGRGSGGVSLTANDGFGNASVTFNHKDGTPEQDGAAGRIVVNTDDNGAGAASMNFQLASQQSDGVSAALPTHFRVKEEQTESLGKMVVKFEGASPALGADRSVTIANGNSGVTSLSGEHDHLVIHDSAEAGITIATPNTTSGHIAFADPQSDSVGRITYEHPTDRFLVRVQDVNKIEIEEGRTTYRHDVHSAQPGHTPANGGTYSFVASAGDSGVTNAASFASQFVAEKNAETGMSILTPNTDRGWIAFGDPQNNVAGGIKYDHAIDTMDFRVNGSIHTTLRGDGSWQYPALGAEPTDAVNSNFARSNGTASTNGFGDSGSGIYEKDGGQWYSQRLQQGTWTPLVKDASGNVGSAVTAKGEWTRNGNSVTIHCKLRNIDTTGLNAGETFYIEGLPYSLDSADNDREYVGAATVDQVTFANPPVAYMDSVTPVRVRLRVNNSNAASNDVIVSEVNSGSADVNFTITYITDKPF